MENLQQHVRLTEIRTETADTKTFRFEPDAAAGTKSLLPFRAGQYTALSAEIGGSFVTRPYSFCSSPADARAGFCELTIQTGGPSMLLATYLHERARVGYRFLLSAPCGEAFYDAQKDPRHVVACASGGGVTPYFSLARAIEAGDEDFELTLLYGSPRWDDIILRERIEAVRSPKFHLVQILENEERPGYGHGLIDGARIAAAAGSAPYSLYICGADAMYEALRRAAAALANKPVRVVREPSCTPALAGGGRPCALTVRQGSAVRTVPARTDETLLVACERAGIRVPNRCRAGACGWCASRLAAGEVFVPAGRDARSASERAAGLVHPCCSYPLCDAELEVPEF